MYATGSAATSTDAVQQLVTFLVAAGWTQDMSQAEGSGWRAHLHKSGNYVHLRASENESAWLGPQYGNAYSINMYLGTGFNGANAWNNQTTGAPIANGFTFPLGVSMSLSAGPFTNFHFFSDSSGNNIVVVIEKTPGMFRHIGWGLSLNKSGSYTGGPYFFGSTSGYFAGFPPAQINSPGFGVTTNCPGVNSDAQTACCTFVRADVDSFTGKWIGIGPNTTYYLGYTGKVGDSSVVAQFPVAAVRQEFPVFGYSSGDFQDRQTSLLDGRVNLLPLFLWVLRDGSSTGYSLLGDIPNVFAANGVGNGFAQSSDYPLGSDTYKLFPQFAVKKVV